MPRYKCMNQSCRYYNQILDEIIKVYSVSGSERVSCTWNENEDEYKDVDTVDSNTHDYQYEWSECPWCAEQKLIEVKEEQGKCMNEDEAIKTIKEFAANQIVAQQQNTFQVGDTVKIIRSPYFIIKAGDIGIITEIYRQTTELKLYRVKVEERNDERLFAPEELEKI